MSQVITPAAELELHTDSSGSLVAIEALKTVPFPIRRAYYIYDVVTNARRGRHAHRRTIQFAVCLRGGCTFLLDDGSETVEVRLERPTRGLLVAPLVWHEMYDFTPDCLLLVLASERYEPADYIRSRPEFLAAVRSTST